MSTFTTTEDGVTRVTDDAPPECPHCASPEVRFSARLGRITYNQCRDCGCNYAGG